MKRWGGMQLVFNMTWKTLFSKKTEFISKKTIKKIWGKLSKNALNNYLKSYITFSNYLNQDMDWHVQSYNKNNNSWSIS